MQSSENTEKNCGKFVDATALLAEYKRIKAVADKLFKDCVLKYCKNETDGH